MVDDVRVFGALLRACRRAAGLSQEELAGRAGLSAHAISGLERGRTRSPYRNSVYRLADALGLREQARTEFIAAAGRRLAPAGTSSVPAAASKPSRPPPRGDRRIVPRQLPAAVPTFTGRDDQLAVLSQVLGNPGTAVVTVIGGTAGVGKTALAVHWAHQVADQFPDGQLFVNLRGFDPAASPVTPADAVRQFLDALQVPAEAIPASLEAQLGLYRSLLAGKRMLVLLDNAADAGQVRPLLPGSPTCRTVVTSRTKLTGLTAANAAHPLLLDILPQAEARQLFTRFLGAERVTAESGAAGQLIDACGHLPLALTITAARAAARPQMPLSTLAAELADTTRRLDALHTAGDPVASVRAGFSWSYRLLDTGTATVFRLAGLHPGADFDHYAAAALTGATADQARHRLDALTDAHMIMQVGPDRYGMHDLLRGYARELAARDAEEERRAALSRLLDYYLYTASAAMDVAFPAERHRRPWIPAPGTISPPLTSNAAAWAWLDAERPSLIAGAALAAGNGWPGHATALSATLFRYLDTAGHFAGARALHDHAARAARRAGDLPAEASALIGLGLAYGQQGRLQEAITRYQQALAISRQAGDEDGQARALNYLGMGDMHAGRCQEAASKLRQALALFRAAGEQTGAAYALSNLGHVFSRQGDHAAAIGHLEQAQACFRELGDRHGQAAILHRIGTARLAQGQCARAAGSFTACLPLYREFGDRMGEADAHADLGLARLRQGHCEQAASHLLQALTCFRELGDQSGQTRTLNGLGETSLAAGRPADAYAHHAAALDLSRQVSGKPEQARAHEGLGNARHAQGDPGQARQHWRQALAIYSELASPEADRIHVLLREATAASPHPMRQ